MNMNLISTFIRREILREKVYRFHLAARIIEGIVKIATFYFIGKYLAPSYFSYVFVGLVFGRTLYFFSSLPIDFIKHEQHWGTMEAVIVGKRSFMEVLLSYSAAKTVIYYFVEIGVYFIGGMIGGFLKGYTVVEIGAALLMVFPYWVVSVILFWSGGIVLAAFSLKIKKIEQSLWPAVAFLEIMSGVYFPTENLPDLFFIKRVAAFLPTTHLLDKWRSTFLLLSDYHSPVFWISYVMLALGFGWVSWYVFKKVFLLSLKSGEVLRY